MALVCPDKNLIWPNHVRLSPFKHGMVLPAACKPTQCFCTSSCPSPPCLSKLYGARPCPHQICIIFRKTLAMSRHALKREDRFLLIGNPCCDVCLLRLFAQHHGLIMFALVLENSCHSLKQKLSVRILDQFRTFQVQN